MSFRQANLEENFRHIAREWTRTRVQAANLEMGYNRVIRIVTPTDLLGDTQWEASGCIFFFVFLVWNLFSIIGLLWPRSKSDAKSFQGPGTPETGEIGQEADDSGKERR